MKVTPQDRATYIVEDQSGSHFVDLLARRGNGQCDCWQFIRKGGIADQIRDLGSRFKPSPKFRCPHIEQADYVLLQQVKAALRKQFNEAAQEKAFQ